MISKLIREDKDYIAFYKPSGLPTVPLKGQNATTLLSEVASLYPEVLSVSGINPWEGSAMHRLDTLTAGIVIFARSQESYDYLQGVQKSGLFVKYYDVRTSDSDKVLEGFPEYCFKKLDADEIVISSRFRPFGRKGSAVRPVTDNPRFQNGPVYYTDVLSVEKDRYLCRLSRGFRHQIRCHMAWSGHPIAGDTLYGAKPYADFGLEAIGVSFPSIDGKEIVFGTTFQHRIR